MTPPRWLTVTILAAAWVLRPSAAIADLAVGQIDTFEDGTTQNWFAAGGPMMAGHPAPPANVADGGPAGLGDAFMRLTATGFAGSPGSRLVVTNTSQWAGDYLAAGVTAIEMDLINLGINELFLRLTFSGSLATNIAYSTVPVFVPVGSGWIRRVFAVGLSDLTLGSGQVSEALTGATLVRLYHSPEPNFPGDPFSPIPGVAAVLGVDNITAVPEPCAVMLMSAFLLILVRWRASGASTIED